MESFSSKKTRISTSLKSVSPTLTTRRSTIELSPPSDLPPTSIPQRPLRNPARGDSRVPDTPTSPKTRKRPSTATGAPEQVAPWLASSPNDSTSNIPSPSAISPSVSTRSRSRSSLVGTGPVEEVTPWELYPVRPTTTRHTLSTGPKEEVTPWELYPVSASNRNRSSLSTGLVEDVTPWDLFPVPILEDPVKSNKRSSRSSVSRIDLIFTYRRLQVYLFIWSCALFWQWNCDIFDIDHDAHVFVLSHSLTSCYPSIIVILIQLLCSRPDLLHPLVKANHYPIWHRSGNLNIRVERH